MPKHRFDHDADCCQCGGQIVYYEEAGTHGCENGGPMRKQGLPVDGWLRPIES